MKVFFIISTIIKGMLMGAADIVPGVSGGTMAFITNIYERLISSLSSFNIEALKLLVSGRRKALWRWVDAGFLLSLMVGLGMSVILLSGPITLGLEKYPHLMYAFFAGLIIASAEMIHHRISSWNWKKYLFLVVGLGIGVLLTQITPTELTPSYLMVFLSATIAICAMILPGISGSFMLLLMGMYEPVMNAIHARNIMFILVFALGAIVGLLSFVHLVKYFFSRYHDITVATLVGLMLGSLPKLWPWQYSPLGYSCPSTTPWGILLGIIGVFILGYAIVKIIESKTPKM